MSSIAQKRFKKVSETQKNVQIDQKHPSIVVADLRRGSLDSLDKYLAHEGGIPDRQIAVELRKLIKGSFARTPFRLVVLDHPNRPKDKGGRTKLTIGAPLLRQFEIAELYEAEFLVIRKKELAAEQVASAKNVSRATVYRALKRVEAYLRSNQQAK